MRGWLRRIRSALTGAGTLILARKGQQGALSRPDQELLKS